MSQRINSTTPCVLPDHRERTRLTIATARDEQHAVHQLEAVLAYQARVYDQARAIAAEAETRIDASARTPGSGSAVALASICSLNDGFASSYETSGIDWQYTIDEFSRDHYTLLSLDWTPRRPYTLSLGNVEWFVPSRKWYGLAGAFEVAGFQLSYMDFCWLMLAHKEARWYGLHLETNGLADILFVAKYRDLRAHIFDFKDDEKTAFILAHELEPGRAYNDDIVGAAHHLIAQRREHFVYGGQHANGTTWWIDLKTDERVVVTDEEAMQQIEALSCCR
jgi:hypothetical protein